MIRTENTLPHAHMRWGFNASSTGTRLLSLSTIADAKISNPPWVNFQSAGWVSFQSAPTVMGFRQFLLRGKDKVSGEWRLVCLAWNLKRMAVMRHKSVQCG